MITHVVEVRMNSGHSRTRRCALACAVAAVEAIASATPIVAQASPRVPPEVASAVRARESWARAARAETAHDSMTALREASTAAAEWPWQPAYQWGRAITAARVNAPDAVRDALARFAALGGGRDITVDARFERMRERSWFAGLADSIRRNAAELATGRRAAELPDSTFWPEGFDVDRTSGTLYVTSIMHHTVGVLEASHRYHELWPRDDARLGGVLAVRVDAAHDVVYATTMPSRAVPAELLRVDRGSGRILHRWMIGKPASNSAPGEILIAANGDIYVTDSSDPALLVVRSGSDSLERITHPYFHSPQGMAQSPDRRFLFVADYSLGLLRFDTVSRTVMRLADPRQGTTLGLDGIAWWKDGLIAIQNGITPPRVVRIRLDDAVAAVTSVDVLERVPSLAPEPTSGVVVGDEFFYLANSQWNEHDDAGQPRAGGAFRRPVVRAVPLVAKPAPSKQAGLPMEGAYAITARPVTDSAQRVPHR